MTAVIALVVSGLVVLLTSLVKREHWSVKTKTSLNVVLSTVGGWATLYLDKTGNAKTLLNTLQHSGIILGLSSTLYQLGFRGTPLDKFLTSVNSLPSAPSTTVVNNTTVVK